MDFFAAVVVHITRNCTNFTPRKQGVLMQNDDFNIKIHLELLICGLN